MLHTEDPQIFGVKVQNLVARVTWRPGFVHPWHRVPVELNSRLLRSGNNLKTGTFLESYLTYSASRRRLIIKENVTEGSNN
jgi:hypothetical protein